MAKAELRTRTSKSGKSKARTPATRKRKAAATKAGKAFMLKDKAADPTALAKAPKRKNPAPKRRTAPKVIAPPEPVVEERPAPAKAAPRQALVVWQKRGPVEQIRHWLRLTGREIVRLYMNPAPNSPAPVEVKLRTRNDLLQELAVLRQENATMRERLGLPQMPLGRLVADSF